MQTSPNTYASFKSHIERHPERYALIALMALGLLTRFFMLHHPHSAVFDEVHFNYFAGFYYTGQYYYDIHPPLGKLLIALSAYPFGGIAPEDVVRTISTPFPSSTYIAMRSIPALFGAALPALLFLIARELNIRVHTALLAGLLVVLDNALLIQSRLICLDTMLLGFGFLSLWLFLRARRQHNIYLFCLSAVFAGCSLSIKWIGISFLGLIGLIIIADWFRALWRKQGWTPYGFYRGCTFLALTITTYVCIFYVHFGLLPMSHKQGDQFMSLEFRATLEGSEYQLATGSVISFKCPEGYKHSLRYWMPNTQVKPAEAIACRVKYKPIEPPGFFKKFAELNRVMYTTNQGLDKTHPDASAWYSWPIMAKPLYYWHSEGARIYLLGNPVVWWLCSLGVVILLIGQLFKPQWRHNKAFWILMTGYWANLLPFLLVSRIMFMYHYLTSLCFSILLLAYLLEQVSKPTWLKPAILAMAVCGFVLVSPLTYGINWFGSDMLWFLRLFGWHP